MLIYLQMIETEEEQSKFEVIYHEYFPLMFHIAYQILRHQQDAEDAVHQAFVSIAENITKIDQPLSPQTKRYVAVIAENKAIDVHRKSQRHPITSLEDVSPGIGIPVEYDGDDELVKCILELNPLQRQVIWLKYHYGYSLREISSMLKISLPWAIQLDQRAKKKLKKLYEERGNSL